LKTTKLGTITQIEEIHEFRTKRIGNINGNNGSRLGVTQMLNSICGNASMDGYKVTTDKTEILVLIDNGQSCCESWGYMASEDDLSAYIGAELQRVLVTDTALNREAVERSGFYDGECSNIQFVDFETSKGVFQLAVYNAHNGYYGHGIVVAIGDDIIHQDTL
jgi:hypothetical protein